MLREIASRLAKHRRNIVARQLDSVLMKVRRAY